mmetsp:Transcript_3501/g.7195  ORF Transcript_3501/g.7195 Transcript_3501/m.7195 type:complete len:226 (-) Transcript_3501:1029-1706(-)
MTARIIMTRARLRIKSWCATASSRFRSRYSSSSFVSRFDISFTSILLRRSVRFIVLASVTTLVRSRSCLSSATSSLIWTACSNRGVILSPTAQLIALSPANASVRTTPGSVASLEASARPSTGHPSPSCLTQACPDPSHLGPMYSPLFTPPSTHTGTCPRKQHQWPNASSSGDGRGSPFHFALSSETTMKMQPSSGAASGRIFPSCSITTLPLQNFPTPSSRKKK